MVNDKELLNKEKHQEAYKKLKEIQRKYGFENIAELRSFYNELEKTFYNFDQTSYYPKKGEEIEHIFEKIFKFFSTFDELKEDEIPIEYEKLKEEMIQERLSPVLQKQINSFYESRINSDIEKKRREILRQEKELKETLTEFYLKKWNQDSIKAINDAFLYAFGFPTPFTNWNNFPMGNFDGFEKKGIYHGKQMREAMVPEEIIKNFAFHASQILRYKDKLEKEKQALKDMR